MKKIFLMGLGLSGLLVFSGCKKYDKSNAPAVNAVVENAFTEMTNMSDQAVTGNLVYYKLPTVTVRYASASSVDEVEKTGCNVVITLDTVGAVDTLVIDWGTTNCDCNDGKTRRGKIITTWTGNSYYNQGTIIKHTPVDYYVNDNKIEGTKTVENMGNNSSGQPYYNVNINGVATLSSGEIVTYTSTRVRTFTAGYTSQAWFWDDEYDITGSASAVVVNGDSYSATITSPLHFKVGCPYITQGTLDFTPTGKPTRTIDYGSGSCDATFTITVNGHTYTVN